MRNEDSLKPTENTLADLLVLKNSDGPRRPPASPPQFVPACLLPHLIHTYLTRLMCECVIHSKSWFRWFPETAEKLEFSAERSSENAKTVNFSMCVRNKGQEEGLLPFYS